MDFEISKEEQQVVKAAKDFTEKELAPGVLERDATSEFPVDAFMKFGKMGMFGIPYSKEIGGVGGSYLSYILAVEEVSKVDGSFGIAYSVMTSLFGGTVANSSASNELKAYAIGPISRGEKVGSFGLTEREAGSDAAGQKTIAEKDGDHYILNGTKIFNTNGPFADMTTVYCLTDPSVGVKSMACFLVEKGTPGFTVGALEDKMGIRSAQVSEMHLENVRVPAENMLAQPGEGFKLAMVTLDGGRVGVAAQALGIAKGAFEIAVQYLKEREQFGKPLAEQQYLAFKMAELQRDIKAAELLLWNAAVAHDSGRRFSTEAAMAKMTCSDVAMKVTTECVQMLGGNGYMKGYHVERMMRDAKITQIYEGTNEILKLVMSKLLFADK